MNRTKRKIPLETGMGVSLLLLPKCLSEFPSGSEVSDMAIEFKHKCYQNSVDI